MFTVLSLNLTKLPLPAALVLDDLILNVLDCSGRVLVGCAYVFLVIQSTLMITHKGRLMHSTTT
jgi:hypothetical protein